MTIVMRKIIGCIFFWIMFLCVFVAYTHASNHDAELAKAFKWHSKISVLKQTLKDKQSEKNELLKQSDKLVKKIIQEKRKSKGVSNRKLDSLLSKSQQLVSSLDSISIQIDENREQLKQNYSEAITDLVNLLETELKQKDKKKLVKQLVNYFQKYEELSEEKPLQIPLVNIEIQENDTNIDIRKKADFLSDQTVLLKAKMFQIDEQVTKLEKEKALRDKVKKFADEINFFDETLFVEEKKVTQDYKAEVFGTNEENIPVDDQDGPLMSVRFDVGEISDSIMFQSEAFESSPSDMIFTSSSMDDQIRALRQQKLQFGDQVKHLLEKTKNFYKMSEE